MPPTPTVGRAVHYVSRGSADGVYPPACRAATVSEVDMDGPEHDGQPNVGAVVTNPTGHFFHPLAHGGGLRYDGGHNSPGGDTHMCDGLLYAPGTWHWPART